jgi:hypothetical protein
VSPATWASRPSGRSSLDERWESRLARAARGRREHPDEAGVAPADEPAPQLLQRLHRVRATAGSASAAVIRKTPTVSRDRDGRVPTDKSAAITYVVRFPWHSAGALARAGAEVIDVPCQRIRAARIQARHFSTCAVSRLGTSAGVGTASAGVTADVDELDDLPIIELNGAERVAFDERVPATRRITREPLLCCSPCIGWRGRGDRQRCPRDPRSKLQYVLHRPPPLTQSRQHITPTIASRCQQRGHAFTFVPVRAARIGGCTLQ